MELKCIHHWIIDIPTGSLSLGICKKCKESKEFQNSIAREFSITGFGKNTKKKRTNINDISKVYTSLGNRSSPEFL